MRVAEAIDRISHIHAQLAKSEVYRGSRPLPILVAACAGMLAAVVQPCFVAPGDAAAFLRYWSSSALARQSSHRARSCSGTRFARVASNAGRRDRWSASSVPPLLPGSC